MRNSFAEFTCGLLMLGLMVLSAPLNAQIFSEDFQGGVLPAGWAVFDGDGQTPNSNVSFFNAAWIVREDFDLVGDTAAMSNSWYFPLTGPSNDWLITPRINVPANTELRWEGESQDANFPESYEVLASAATAQLPVSNFTNVLTSINGESGAFRTQRMVSLSGVTGDHYFAWRNISFDQYILVIDNIEIRTVLAQDVEMTFANSSEFTIVPFSQAASIPLSGRIQNIGLDSASSVSLTVNVYDGNFSQVYSNTSATQPLGVGAIANLSVPSFSPAAQDFYTFEYIANRSGNDQDRSNDTLYWSLQVSDSVMARDDGVVNSTLGIGAGNGGIMGQTFILTAPEYLNSVTTYMEVKAGQPYFAEIYNFNGTPTSVIARTDTFVPTADTALTLTLPLSGGAMLMPADTFFIGIPEPDSTLAIGYSLNIFTPEATWLDWPTNPMMMWSHNEDFGFDASYVLRANLTLPCPSYVLTASVTNASCGTSDGAATVSVIGGGSPLTYLWSNGQTMPTAINLAAGQYSVVVTDTNACQDSLLVTVNNVGAPSIDSMLAQHPLCFGDATGSASVVVSGGQAPYAYTWSTGDTTAGVSGLAAGMYTVTVVDQSNCQSIATVAVVAPAVIAANIFTNGASCGTCPDGLAVSNPSGGTPPYSYSWSSSANTGSSEQGLVPGTYTVQVTDSNGCMVTDTFVIGLGIGIDDVAESQIQLFPNPSNGAFQLLIAAEALTDIQVGIYNHLGQLAWEMEAQQVDRLEKQFDVQDLAAGSYLLRIKVGERVAVRKLVIW